MTPIFQTIVDPNKGNCMQAAFASLFDLQLDQVPNFIEHKDWFPLLYKLIRSQGAEFDGTLYNNYNKKIIKDCRFNQIKKMTGVNGYFYASVYSPKYYDSSLEDDEYQTTHAVIIDKKYKIVHDPNPAYKGLKKYPRHEKLGYNGILTINIINLHK